MKGNAKSRGRGRFTEKVPRRIILRSSCFLGWRLMKLSRGEKRLRPGQDDLDRLGARNWGKCVPLSHNAYRKESSNIQVLYKEKSYHHQVVGPLWSRRSLVLRVRTLEEMTELVQLPTLGSQRVAFTLTISFGLHINNGLDRLLGPFCKG